MKKRDLEFDCTRRVGTQINPGPRYVDHLEVNRKREGIKYSGRISDCRKIVAVARRRNQFN